MPTTDAVTSFVVKNPLSASFSTAFGFSGEKKLGKPVPF